MFWGNYNNQGDHIRETNAFCHQLACPSVFFTKPCRLRGALTVGDLIGLSPLLVDEDDGHQDDDLGHNAQEGPESGQAAADAQLDLVPVGAQVVGSGTGVVADVVFNAQVVNGQGGLVGGALDLVFVAGSVETRLQVC